MAARLPVPCTPLLASFCFLTEARCAKQYAVNLELVGSSSSSRRSGGSVGAGMPGLNSPVITAVVVQVCSASLHTCLSITKCSSAPSTARLWERPPPYPAPEPLPACEHTQPAAGRRSSATRRRLGKSGGGDGGDGGEGLCLVCHGVLRALGSTLSVVQGEAADKREACGCRVGAGEAGSGFRTEQAKPCPLAASYKTCSPRSCSSGWISNLPTTSPPHF